MTANYAPGERPQRGAKIRAMVTMGITADDQASKRFKVEDARGYVERKCPKPRIPEPSS